MTKPHILTTNRLLPFDALDPGEFERMCLWLVEREGYEDAEHLGAAGKEQGRDITAWREGAQWAFQCKRVQRFGPQAALKEIEKVLGLPENERPVGLVFLTTCKVSATTRRQARARCADEMECGFWATTKLDEMVKRHPDVVQEFFDASSELLEQLVQKIEDRLEAMSQPPPQAARSAHLFICYKRNTDPDQKLADYLHERLTAQGHDVFIDSNLRTGAAWLEEIDRQIKVSDFLIVLLSKESADSEMVKAEVRRAYEYRKLQGHPHTLPVRIAYEGMLPYSIDAFLDPLQYVVWQSEADNERVGHEIQAAIEGRLPKRKPIQLRPSLGKATVSEDGRFIADNDVLHSPLPEFDPRWLEELAAPGGAVKLRSKFYVEREADARLKREVARVGTTTTIRAARQTGKSSLLVRGLHHARENEAEIVCVDLQRVDRDYLEMPDVFLRYLADCIVRKLRLDLDQVAKSWRGSLGPQDKLTYLMEDYVLPECDTSIVLALDEADRLLGTDFYRDFFALVRSWHNSRALDDRWNKLNIAMVISTEPYLLIDDMTQSPFNVGLKLYLQDFDKAQVHDLNRRHGSPVKEEEFLQLMELFGGQPYLARKALYTLACDRLTWVELVRVAPLDHGPFGDHLRHHHWLLRDEPGLRKALKQVILHAC